MGIDPAGVAALLSGLPGVARVHDLHIWAMSTTENALTAHLVMPGGHPGDAFLADLPQFEAALAGYRQAGNEVLFARLAEVLAEVTVD